MGTNLRVHNSIAFFLTAFFAACAFAQPAGEVESIGFNNVYRPGCWTGMVVKIKPAAAPSGTYRVQIKQRDLDGDTQVFTREITITAGAAGGDREQRFWAYFIPQPTDRGLPSARDGAALRDIQRVLEVYLCEEDGKQITQLPVTAVPDSVDPPPSGFDSARGVKLVLAINDGNSRPAFDELREGLSQPGKLLGMSENILFMPLRTRDLPENPLAYEAVDAIVWFDADPTSLKTDGGGRMRALEGFVRSGGHLVICQPATNPQRVLGFGDLLPVRVDNVTEMDDVRTLKLLGGIDVAKDEGWAKLAGPFRIAEGRANPGAIVEAYIDPPPEETVPPTTAPAGTVEPASQPRRPYIVRKPYGSGGVTWVAQDLGDPVLTLAARSGWAAIWNRVLDLHNTPVSGGSITDADVKALSPAPGIDLGGFINQGLESKARVGVFIALAILFFILYWLVAGPGLYLFLATRRRTHLSWFGFAAAAVIATAITVLLVKLVLRGPPELTHASLVRGAAGDDANVRARFGLYIPRDGPQEIQIVREGNDDQAAAGNGVSALAALPIHPAHLDSREDTLAKLSYTTPAPDASATSAARLVVPYRSTLKQFAAWWSGPIDKRVVGSITIDPDTRGFIDGRITNGTGRDLQNVYIAYKVVRPDRVSEDWMIYLPSWKADITLDLLRERGAIGLDRIVGAEAGNVPGNGRALIGQIGLDWFEYWSADLRGAAIQEQMWTERSDRPERAFPMLSLFDRLPPTRARETPRTPRVEILRRGARHLDLSTALAAGSVVILAESAPGPDGNDAPLPVPLQVEGDDTPGRGRILYQFVLPAKRPWSG